MVALGAQDRLVDRSHECDFPPGVQDLAVCTASRLVPAASSREIDRAVKAVVALTIFEVDEEALRRLVPDVIFGQDQYDVCAFVLADVVATVARWIRNDAALVTLYPADLASAIEDIRKAGTAIGAAAPAEALTGSFEAGLADIARRSSALKPKPVACI